MSAQTVDQSYLLGVREGVVTIQERLDGSFQGKLYSSLSKATPIDGDYSKDGGQPVRTVVNRSWMTPDKLSPVSQSDFNAKVLNYQKSGFTSEAHDTMVAGRHYVDTKYEATVIKPQVLVDHAWFNTLQELENSFDLKGDKMEKMAINILTAKNVMWLNALTAPKVLRATRDDESDLSTELITLDQSRYYMAGTGSVTETLTFREIALLNAKTKRDMGGKRKLLAMSPIQHALFYDANKEWLKNNDYVPGSDLTELDSIKPFQGGIVPLQIEDIVDIDGNVLFGLDESQMVMFVPDCVSECRWGGLTADCAVDGHAYNEVQAWRKEVLGFSRTSDRGVMIITIAGLVPTLKVGTTETVATETSSLTPAKSASEQTLYVKTNGARMTPQAWNVTTTADWITITPGSGDGDGSFKVAFAANATSSARTATISVVSDVPGYAGDTSLTKTISVTQAA